MTEILTMDQIAEIGEKIYAETLQEKYENDHANQFLAIDVTTQDGYVGQYPEDALSLAEKTNPDGQFYLKRIGSSATFHVSYTGEMNVEGILPAT
ncbi:MAG: hypothetical protein OXE94_00165 [Aestuariivita sp.]|nr:hypothetical protein [Aestuariivita sp.]MCY4202116.1 hypothetical protein [Aestuariivita sp.]MCY4288049.1 hypothetical protein [Aestuariivita sp.]MCY4345818.1 hypothetical protein [Aestuariivita sp.]